MFFGPASGCAGQLAFFELGESLAEDADADAFMSLCSPAYQEIDSYPSEYVRLPTASSPAEEYVRVFENRVDELSLPIGRLDDRREIEIEGERRL